MLFHEKCLPFLWFLHAYFTIRAVNSYFMGDYNSKGAQTSRRAQAEKRKNMESLLYRPRGRWVYGLEITHLELQDGTWSTIMYCKVAKSSISWLVLPTLNRKYGLWSDYVLKNRDKEKHGKFAIGSIHIWHQIFG